MKINTMVLVITGDELEALEDALKFVLDCPFDDPDEDYARILDNTEQLLNKIETVKEVYN